VTAENGEIAEYYVRHQLAEALAFARENRGFEAFCAAPDPNWKQRALQAEDSYARSVDILADALRGPETSPEYDLDVPHPAWANKVALAIRRLRGDVLCDACSCWTSEPVGEECNLCPACAKEYQEQPVPKPSFEAQLAELGGQVAVGADGFTYVYAENGDFMWHDDRPEEELLAFARENRPPEPTEATVPPEVAEAEWLPPETETECVAYLYGNWPHIILHPGYVGTAYANVLLSYESKTPDMPAEIVWQEFGRKSNDTMFGSLQEACRWVREREENADASAR
jgi:hypothetical protein